MPNVHCRVHNSLSLVPYPKTNEFNSQP